MLYLDEYTDETLSLIKTIEAKAYRDTSYSAMGECEDWEDIADYCEAELADTHFLMYKGRNEGSGAYMLFAEHEDHVEIVDFASTGDLTGMETGSLVMKTLRIMEEYGKSVTLDARESTSYPILTGLNRKGLIDISEDNPYEWDGETFHSMRFTVNFSRERNLSSEEIER